MKKKTLKILWPLSAACVVMLLTDSYMHVTKIPMLLPHSTDVRGAEQAGSDICNSIQFLKAKFDKLRHDEIILLEWELECMALA